MRFWQKNKSIKWIFLIWSQEMHKSNESFHHFIWCWGFTGTFNHWIGQSYHSSHVAFPAYELKFNRAPITWYDEITPKSSKGHRPEPVLTPVWTMGSLWGLSVYSHVFCPSFANKACDLVYENTNAASDHEKLQHRCPRMPNTDVGDNREVIKICEWFLCNL